MWGISQEKVISAMPRFSQGAARHAFLLALAILASVNLGQEGEEAADPKDIKEQEELETVHDVQAEAVAAEKGRELMWTNFKEMVDSYAAENKRLVEQNYIISREIDDGRVGVKVNEPITYSKIPNFKFLTAAEPMDKETTLEGCQVECNASA